VNDLARLLTPSLELLMLLFVRTSGVVFTAPPFADAALPTAVRVGASLALTAAAFPLARGLPAPLPLPALLVHLVVEAAVGVAIGIAAQAFVAVATTMGGLIDVASGLSFASLLNPFLSETTSIYASFAVSFALFVFAVSGGFDAFVTAVALSDRILPLGAVPRPSAALLPFALAYTGGAFAAGVLLAFPALVALAVVNVALGLVARILPQMNLFVFSLAVGPLVSLVLVSALLGVAAQALNRYAVALMASLLGFVHAL
jgi:flagellar biosynthetic protein FliR